MKASPAPAPIATPRASRWTRFRPTAPWLVVLAASILFRLPPLINAAGTNSDAAIVGLQAMHILRGEFSWFLLGSGYQTSVDSLVAALVFVFTGPSPLALMASTLVEHIGLTWLTFSVLRRVLGRLPATSVERAGIGAAILVTPLVLTPDPVHTYVLYPPRQASLTLVFLALWLLDGAVASARPRLRLALGGVVAGLACFADPYALLFLPGVALLGGLASLDRAEPGLPPRRVIAERVGSLVAGALVGLIPYQLLIHHPLASRGQTKLSLAAIPHNFELLREVCLPWLLSTRIYAAQHMSDYAPWETGPAYHAFQVVAAALLVIGLLSGAALLFDRTIPWEIRRIGLVGAAMVPVTIGGFLVSPMVMDHFSSRYLVAILLLSPFALAPLASRLGPKRLALGLGPYLISAAVSGWVSYAPFGLATHPSLATDAHLGEVLRERGIHFAEADYWASYRLAFLYREDPIVVPTNEGEDRHRPSRDAFEAAPVVAYIHDAYRSRESLEGVERLIRSGGTPFESEYERFALDQFTVLILRRKVVDSRTVFR
ncbi:MAG: hypothetical protein ABJE95_31445 [Byssovorax sp.]